MNQAAPFLAAMQRSEPNQTIFMTEQQHQMLEKAMYNFLAMPNAAQMASRLYASLQTPSLESEQTDAARQYYVELYFAICVLRAFPFFMHPNDESDELMRRLQQRKKSEHAGALTDGQSFGGYELLEDFIGLSVSVFEFVRNNAFNETPDSSKLRQKELFANNSIGEVQYDNSLFCEQCDFNIDEMLSLPLKTVFNAAMDLVSLIRNKYLLKTIENYAINFLVKDIKEKLHCQLRKAKLMHVTREYEIPYYVLDVNADILVAGGVLSALGSNHAATVLFYLKLIYEEANGKPIAKQSKESQIDPTCVNELLLEFENKLMNIFSCFFGVQNVEIGNLCETKPRELQRIEEILVYDTFHYLVCQLLMPLMQNLDYYERTSEYETEYFTYAYFLKTYCVEPKFQFLLNEGDVTLRKTEENKLFRLNYLQLFCLLLTGRDCCKEVFPRHTVSHFMMPLIMRPTQCQYESFLEKFDEERQSYDQPVFELSDILYSQFTMIKKDVFSSLLESANAKGKAVCAWLAVFRSAYLLLNCVCAERSFGMHILYNNPCGAHSKNYNLIQRNSFFSGWWYCCLNNIDESVSVAKPLEQFNAIDAYLQTAIANLAESREALKPLLLGFFRAETFSRVCSLSLQSLEYSFQLLEGLLLLLGGIGYFSSQKPGYTTLCSLFCVIFAEQALEVEQSHLLRLFIGLAPETQIVFLDALGSYSLGYDAGNSLILQSMANPAVSPQDKEYDQFELLLSEMTNQQLFCDRNGAFKKPFDFLINSSNSLRKLRMIASILTQNGTGAKQLPEIISNCNGMNVNVMRALETAAWLLAYLLNITSWLSGGTLCLEQLNRLLNFSDGDLGDISENLYIYDRTSALKKAFLTLFSTELPRDLSRELLELATLCQPLESHFELDTFGACYEQYGMFEKFVCNELIVCQWFLPSIFNEINSGLYSTKFTTGKSQLRKRDISPAQLMEGLALSPLNANYLLRSTVNIENISEITLGELTELILFAEEGYFILDTATDFSIWEKLISVRLLIMYEQLGCERFLAHFDAAMSEPTFVCKRLVKQISGLVFEVLSYYWQASNSNEHPSQDIVLVCMQIICKFIEEYKASFVSPLIWRNVHEDKVLNYYPILIDALARFYSFAADDRCREAVLLSIRQLLIVINSSDLGGSDFCCQAYNFEFIFNIHAFKRYEKTDLLQILASPYIEPLSLKELLHFILKLDSAVQNGQESLVDDLLTSLLEIQGNCDQTVENLLRPALRLPPSLVFVLSFCQRYKHLASQQFQLSIIQKQKIGCTSHEVQILRDLLLMYELFASTDYEAALAALAPFGSVINEIQSAVLQALQYLFTSISLYSQPAANDFVNTILEHLTLNDTMFAAEIYASTSFAQDMANNKEQLSVFAKERRYASSELLALLLPILLKDLNNANFVQGSHCQSYFQHGSAVKCCICIEMLFLANPCMFFEQFCEKSMSTATESAFSLFCIKIANESDNLVFYEYLFKQKLNYLKELNQIAPPELLYDNFLEGFDEKMPAFGSFKNEQKDQTIVFKELKNNINSFLFAGICSIVVYFNCDEDKVAAMTAPVGAELDKELRQNDVVLETYNTSAASGFIALIRACLDYSGCVYNIGTVQLLFSHPNLSEFATLTEMIFKQMMTSSLRLQNDFLEGNYQQGNTVVFRVQKPTMDREFIEQTFQSQWTEETLKSVENFGILIEEGVLESTSGFKQISILLISLFNQKSWSLNSKLIGASIFAIMLSSLRECDQKCRIRSGMLIAIYNILSYILDKFEVVSAVFQKQFMEISAALLNVLPFEHHEQVFHDTFAEIVLRLRIFGLLPNTAANILVRYAECANIVRPELILVRAWKFWCEKSRRNAYACIYNGRAILLADAALRARVTKIEEIEVGFESMFLRVWECLLEFYKMDWLPEPEENR